MPVHPDLAQDCVQFLQALRRYLGDFEGLPGAEGTTIPGPSEAVHPREDRDPRWEDKETYLNVSASNPGDDTRAQLVVQCEALLRRFETHVCWQTEGDEAVQVQVDEESSYIDMSGTKALKDGSNSSLTSTGAALEVLETGSKDDDQVNDPAEENSYDLTTDQILYDECQLEVDYEREPAILAQPIENAQDENQCPYGGLPASHLRLQQSPKHGTLFKQEKRLFFDQFKKYYVGLIGKWLLVYNNHNDLKPWQTIFIKGIRLDLSLNEQINEKHLFQIITHTDSKVHFLSPSFQDLNEWIVAIENNLIERTDRSDDVTAQQIIRKLPLPPCPTRGTEDETDRSHVEDGIYEEPTMCRKVEDGPRGLNHGYDTPKPCNARPVDAAASLTKNGSDTSLKSHLTAKPPDANVSVVTTPKKSWLKNRFNRSPPDPIEGKVSKKALKKLSFEELSAPDPSVEPKSPTKPNPAPFAPKFSLTTTPSSKGTKINMIISQLEANGQLNLLSKQLKDTQKRYTWFADDVVG